MLRAWTLCVYVIPTSKGGPIRHFFKTDLVRIQRGEERLHFYPAVQTQSWKAGLQGPEARPLHISAQYGLLAPGLRRLEEKPDTRGGLCHYPLLAAAAGDHKDVARCLVKSGADLQIVGPREKTYSSLGTV